MKRIGFIGLGIMGKPMCRNLLKAGYELTVYSRTQSSVDQIVEAGAKAAASPKDVAARSDMIITMLPNSPQVKEVVLGPGGVIEGAASGSIVVDMSSIAPLASQEIAAELAKKGVRMMDAPVSGGEPKAVEGTLSVMVGGTQTDFDQCLPVLKSMAASVVLVGAVGAGNVTKLANQIVVALNIAAMSEALVLAAKARALMAGRFHVGIEDLEALVGPALGHRIALNFDGQSEGITPAVLLVQVVEAVHRARSWPSVLRAE